jgi:hypothetical protein
MHGIILRSYYALSSGFINIIIIFNHITPVTMLFIIANVLGAGKN